MEHDQGKLFIGGISWETTEDKLKNYFSAFGEVVEAVVMKGRTGRPRGFGFIVFADPMVADRVVLEKHGIDGRMVEAKKAIPRDDQQNASRPVNGSTGSPAPLNLSRSKKIFVGGLASSVTENDFRKYFEQFGTITDVVVMYDHGTKRPRGFGFITYDSEDSVERILKKTFHEMNGKIVEVKRAIPKELSASLSRSNGFNTGSGSGNRGSPCTGNYMQSLNSGPVLPRFPYKNDRCVLSPSTWRLYSYCRSMIHANPRTQNGFLSDIYSSYIYPDSESHGGGGHNSGTHGSSYFDSVLGSPHSTFSDSFNNSLGKNHWSDDWASYEEVSISELDATRAAWMTGHGGLGTWNFSQLSSNSIATSEDSGYRNEGADGVVIGSNQITYLRDTSFAKSLALLGVGRPKTGSGTCFEDIYHGPGFGDSTWRATLADKIISAGFRIGENGAHNLARSFGISDEKWQPIDNGYSFSRKQTYRDVNM